jgi:hypothetical protein
MIRRGLMVTACFALAAAAPAYADMFTWVDKDGVTNISNEPPPEGVRVTKVVRSAPKDAAREAAARDAARMTEMRALRDRVDDLTKEVEQSRASDAAAVRAGARDGVRAAARRADRRRHRDQPTARNRGRRAVRSRVRRVRVGFFPATRITRRAVPARIPQAASRKWPTRRRRAKAGRSAAAHSVPRTDAAARAAPVGLNCRQACVSPPRVPAIGAPLGRLALAAPEVVAQRVMRMWLAGARHSRAIATSSIACGREKFAAFYESWNAMALEMFRATSRSVFPCGSLTARNRRAACACFRAARARASPRAATRKRLRDSIAALRPRRQCSDAAAPAHRSEAAPILRRRQVHLAAKQAAEKPASS